MPVTNHAPYCITSDQRLKFEKFCSEQLERAKDLELKVKGDLSEAEERRFVAKNRFQIAKNKVLIQRNHQIDQNCEIESKVSPASFSFLLLYF